MALAEGLLGLMAAMVILLIFGLFVAPIIFVLLKVNRMVIGWFMRDGGFTRGDKNTRLENYRSKH